MVTTVLEASRARLTDSLVLALAVVSATVIGLTVTVGPFIPNVLHQALSAA